MGWKLNAPTFLQDSIGVLHVPMTSRYTIRTDQNELPDHIRITGTEKTKPNVKPPNAGMFFSCFSLSGFELPTSAHPTGMFQFPTPEIRFS